MILVLDANATLWWLRNEATLSAAARGAIADPANEVIVSAATIWELEIKRALVVRAQPPYPKCLVRGPATSLPIR